MKKINFSRIATYMVLVLLSFLFIHMTVDFITTFEMSFCDLIGLVILMVLGKFVDNEY